MKHFQQVDENIIDVAAVLFQQYCITTVALVPEIDLEKKDRA